VNKETSRAEVARIEREEHRLLGKLVAAQREGRRKDKLAAPPQVGIVFLVDGKLHIDGTPLNDAPGYGDFRIHEKDHYSYWNELLRVHAVPKGEYDEYPRGRVVYDTRTRSFTLFLDQCILKHKDVVKKIRVWMHLPSRTPVETDSHYRCPACMRSKRSFDED